MTARAITKALGGMWSGSYGLVRCPAHDDRKPSLKVSDDPDKRDGIDLHCFAGCSWQDVKAELARQGLIDRVDRTSGPADAHPKPKSSQKSHANFELSPTDRTRIALGIWEQSVRLNHTLGWRYFTERRQLHIGLLPDLKHVLRWHEGEQAVIGLMTNPLTNKPTGVHRTYLRPDATNALNEDGSKKKKMLGPMGVIRLSADHDVTQGLGLCEGIEDGLAILLSGWSPVWVGTCAGAIKNFPVLSGVEALTIFGDSDPAGMEAACICAERWRENGCDVTISGPKGDCYD
jgi:hypothetical protein